MSARMDGPAARRKALIERCDRERAELAALLGGIEDRFALVDTVVTGARRLSRHRLVVGAAGVFMLVAPVVARTWVRRALWLLPVVLEGYRAVKSRAGDRRASSPANGS